MSLPSARRASLSLCRAFVVQCWAETKVTHGQCEGRVGHVGSGQAMQFRFLEELLAFIARMLAQMRAQRPDEP